jgi:hypothetical protein
MKTLLIFLIAKLYAMKKTFTIALLNFLMLGLCSGQLETFEDETEGATSFTVDGIDFTVTGDFLIEIYEEFGCGGSDYFLGTGTLDGPSQDTLGTIKATDPNFRFTISTSSSWCVYISRQDGLHGLPSGDVKFTGSLRAGGTIEDTIHIERDFDTPMDPISFAPEIWEDQELTELHVIGLGSINYIALDNIKFDEIITTTRLANVPHETLQIHPNPVKSRLGIIGSNTSRIKVLSAMGRIVKEQAWTDQEIDVSGLATGIYFLQLLFDDGRVSTSKFVKK